MPGQALCESLVNISQINATVAAADVVRKTDKQGRRLVFPSFCRVCLRRGA